MFFILSKLLNFLISPFYWLLFFIAMSLVFLASCSSGTAIVSSWKDPETTNANTEFKKILVVALVKNEATRRITENRIAAIGPKFHSSYAILNGTSLELSKEQKLKILKDENVQKWDKDYDNYSPSDVDTFIWELKMENPDLTAETHGGQATAKEEGIPKNFDAVAKKLLTFAENKANSQM